MSALLSQAVAAAQLLSLQDQDALAAMMMAEIENDRCWEESFAKSPGKLAELAKRATEQLRNGEFTEGGFDSL